MRHLGASPIAVAKTRRLHFAKKLIDETKLPMGQIALASGFGSVRRFNAAFQQTYSRTPGQIRRLAHLSSPQPENEYLVRLHFRPPFHWDALLAFLSRRAIPGVEAVAQSSYRRTISLNGHSGSLGVSLDEVGPALEVRISFPEPRWLFLIVERLRRVFDLAADPHEIATHLAGDALLANRIEAMPGLRVPGCWDGFELAVRAILGQQVSVTGANTLTGRLVRTFGTPITKDVLLTHLFPTPEALADGDVARIGLPKKRAETIRALARAVSEGQIDFGSVANGEDFHSCLRELPGIGIWTGNTLPCAQWATQTHFRQVIWVCCEALHCTTSANSRNVLRVGDRGEPTPQCTCGKEQMKSHPMTMKNYLRRNETPTPVHVAAAVR